MLMPRSSKKPERVSSIRLLGQDAPAVIPTTTGPWGEPFVRDYFATLVQVEVENFLVREHRLALRTK